MTRRAREATLRAMSASRRDGAGPLPRECEVRPRRPWQSLQSPGAIDVERAIAGGDERSRRHISNRKNARAVSPSAAFGGSRLRPSGAAALHVLDQLLERLAPAVAEAHRLVLLHGGLVGVHDDGGVLGALALRL